MHYSPSTLKPINTQEINTQLDRALCMADGGTLVQHDAPGRLQLLDNGARAVPRRLDDGDALVNDGLGVGSVVGRVERWQEGDVHAEWVLGHGPAPLDLLAQVGRRGEQQPCD